MITVEDEGLLPLVALILLLGVIPLCLEVLLMPLLVLPLVPVGFDEVLPLVSVGFDKVLPLVHRVKLLVPVRAQETLIETLLGDLPPHHYGTGDS